MKQFKNELSFPGKVINRKGIEKWQASGYPSTEKQAANEVTRILETHEAGYLDKHCQNELESIIKYHANR
jgi:trimethylamine:corrinoid methyltransferase-like protein